MSSKTDRTFAVLRALWELFEGPLRKLIRRRR